jgi:Ca2+-binding EF-hand superfamily protein
MWIGLINKATFQYILVDDLNVPDDVVDGFLEFLDPNNTGRINFNIFLSIMNDINELDKHW